MSHESFVQPQENLLPHLQQQLEQKKQQQQRHQHQQQQLYQENIFKLQFVANEENLNQEPGLILLRSRPLAKRSVLEVVDEEV